MIEAVIVFLIWALLLAAVIFLVIWVLRDIIGLPIPGKVIQILWVVFALIALLYLVRIVVGGRRLDLSTDVLAGGVICSAPGEVT